MKASDTPDPTSGVMSGRIPAAQFELCIRCVGINAPRAVFNTLFDIVGVDENGEVDYVKYLEDLEIEEVLGIEKTKERRKVLKSQIEREDAYNKYRQQQREQQQVAQYQKAKRAAAPSSDGYSANADTRTCIEVDYIPGQSPSPQGIPTKSYFKPKHLVSAYTNDIQTVFCLPGGSHGEMRDSQAQHPIEAPTLNSEMRHYRDSVLASKVQMQKLSRSNGGDDAYI